MIYFIEQWNVKPAWLAMALDERQAYLAQVGAHTQNLLDKGVEVVTWSANDPATTHKADFDYFAIWAFPDETTANAFQETVQNAGWYQYFEQANMMGKADTPENVLGQLAQR